MGTSRREAWIARARRVGRFFSWIVSKLAKVEARATANSRSAHTTVIFFFAVLYGMTLYPGVGGVINMGDSAKFQFLSVVHGIGHPPGNPLYLLVDAAMGAIPLPLSPALKTNLLSAICGIATLSFTFRIILLVSTHATGGATESESPEKSWPLGPPRTALLGTLLLGLGPLFWTLSTEAEVYTLSTFFSSLTILLLSRWVLLKDERALAFGLCVWLIGFGNHLSIVSLIPSVLWLCVTTWKSMKRKLRTFALATLGALIGAGTYGYIYLRVKGTLPYSEFTGPLGVQTFADFITAKPYRSAIGNFGFSEAMRVRFPVVLTELQQQWIWPLLFVLPFGIARVYRASSKLFTYLGLVLLGQVAFGFLYPIPDPEGFFMPLFAPISLFLVAGISTLYLSKRRIWLLGLSGFAVLLFATMHVVDFWTTILPDMWMGTRDGTVAIVFPTLFDAMPDNSMFAVPCGHYGCVEMTNYYRLADSTVQRKHITFVRFPWSEWESGLGDIPVISAQDSRSKVVCTIMPGDLKKLQEASVATTRIKRAPFRRHTKKYIPAALICTGTGLANGNATGAGSGAGAL